MSSSSAIVVFAHVPPPHHGQSYMVKMMLDGLAKESPNLKVYHVNAQVSEDLADVGSSGLRKLGRLIRYCAQAIRFRIFEGAKVLYYIPAPAKKSAIIRDVVALSLLRPFFPRLILHWHAVGLGEWVAGSDGFEQAPSGLTAKLLRPLVQRLLRGADPAICIAEGNAQDAGMFMPRRMVVVPNGIPDSCPNYAAIAERRRKRTEDVRQWLDGTVTQPEGEKIRLAYLGHCLRTKGFFDALTAIQLSAADRPDLRWQLDVAGTFMTENEAAEGQAAFEQLKQCGVGVKLHGFLPSDAKSDFLERADVMLFPSWSESFGLVAVEALAHGLPVIGSDIPGIRSVLSETGCTLVAPQDSKSLAGAICRSSSYADADVLRRKYEQNFTLEIFQKRIAEALR